jgi:Mg2+ and Co2+ transporter CorA
MLPSSSFHTHNSNILQLLDHTNIRMVEGMKSVSEKNADMTTEMKELATQNADMTATIAELMRQNAETTAQMRISTEQNAEATKGMKELAELNYKITEQGAHQATLMAALAYDSKRDSEVMKTITVVTLIFLPGTFVSVCLIRLVFGIGRLHYLDFPDNV